MNTHAHTHTHSRSNKHYIQNTIQFRTSYTKTHKLQTTMCPLLFLFSALRTQNQYPEHAIQVANVLPTDTVFESLHIRVRSPMIRIHRSSGWSIHATSGGGFSVWCCLSAWVGKKVANCGVCGPVPKYGATVTPTGWLSVRLWVWEDGYTHVCTPPPHRRTEGVIGDGCWVSV